MARVDGVHLNGHPVARLPHNASLTFEGTIADRLMMDMKDIAVSSGSACSSAVPGQSHVLRAIGLSDADVRATLRFGLGRFTTREEIVYVIDRVVQTVSAARTATVVAAGQTIH
jgi:cysteine desulfurase